MAGSKKTKSKQKPIDDGFLMSPKIDFVFKLIFGDDKNKDLLIALLSAILGVPKEEFEGMLDHNPLRPVGNCVGVVPLHNGKQF